MPAASTRCPYCFGRMKVKTLICDSCGTQIRSNFVHSRLLQLTPAQQKFVAKFVEASGSLKEMANVLGVSYPTVRSRLDRIIEVLKGEEPGETDRRAAILDAVEDKRLSPEDAAALLARLDSGEEPEEKGQS